MEGDCRVVVTIGSRGYLMGLQNFVVIHSNIGEGEGE